jgi:hypothetical protein
LARLKATGSIKLEAMPFTPAAIAWSNAVTIWDTLELAEPVHSGLGMPRRVAASAIPYWVGVKKLLVVTWLTNVNLYEGCFANNAWDSSWNV